MKHINVTFSLPPEIHKALQSLIGRKKMSAFVAEVLSAALAAKKAELKRAYMEAASDDARKELFQEWSSIDTGDWEW